MLRPLKWANSLLIFLLAENLVRRQVRIRLRPQAQRICESPVPKGLSMGETGSVALLRPIFVVTHYRPGNLRTENLRNLYGVEGGTLTKVVASDKQSEPMLDRWISTHAAHEHWI